MEVFPDAPKPCSVMCCVQNTLITPALLFFQPTYWMVSIYVDTLLIHLMIVLLQSLASFVMLQISLSPNRLCNITGQLLITTVSWALKLWEGLVQKNILCALNVAFFTPKSLCCFLLLFYFLLLLFPFLLFVTTLRKAEEVTNSLHISPTHWF